MTNSADLLNTMWQPRLAKGSTPMRVWGKEGITCPCMVAGGRDGEWEGCTGNRLFGKAVCHSYTYGGSRQIEVIDGCIRCKVEATGT